MKQWWMIVSMCLLLLVSGSAQAQQLEPRELVSQGSGAVAEVVATSLEIMNPTGHPGEVILVDKATLPPEVRERWWSWLEATSHAFGFGLIARSVVVDPEPLGGPDLCTDEVLAVARHADTRVVLCTEVAMGSGRDGLLTLTGWSRPDGGTAWTKARRNVPLVNFDFNRALRSATQNFLMVRMSSGRVLPPPGFTVPRTVAPPRPVAGTYGRTGAAPSTPRATPPRRPATEERPHLGLSVNVGDAIDGVFSGAVEIGVSEPISVVIRGGGSSEESELLKVSATQVGGMLRWYLTRPMRDFYFGAGLMYGGGSIVSPLLEVQSYVVSFQPAVGFKVAMTPGLSLLVEGGLNLQLDASSNLEVAQDTSPVPSSAVGYGLIEVGLSL